MAEQVAEIEALAEPCRENPGIDVGLPSQVDAAERRIVADRGPLVAATPQILLIEIKETVSASGQCARLIGLNEASLA